MRPPFLWAIVGLSDHVGFGRDAPYPDSKRRRNDTRQGDVALSWILLIISGLLECCWAVALKSSDGFTKPLPSLTFLITLIASMGLLAVAAKELPIGTAYAVWVGIGAMGTALVGIFWLGETASAARLLCLAGLAFSLIGLKLTA